MPEKAKKAILRMSVPRNNERGPLAFEQILANLHGLLIKSTKEKEFHEQVSFEIVRINKRIYFYVVVPSHLRTLISSQIYSQYPDVEIEEVPEFFTKKLIAGKKLLFAELRPAESMLLPFKRHPQFEDKSSGKFEDPIGPIASALSQLYATDDSAVIQFVVSPVPPQWNKTAEKVFKLFSSGAGKSHPKAKKIYEKAMLSPDPKIQKSLFWKKIGAQFFLMKGNENPLSMEKEGKDQTSGSHDRESVMGAIYDKITRLNFAVNIRTLYIHSDPEPDHAEAKIREIIGTFQQFSLPQMNHFTVSKIETDQNSILFRDLVTRNHRDAFVLSQEEFATMFHLPTQTVTSAGIAWVTCPKFEPPIELPTEGDGEITLIGETNFRDQRKKYGIQVIDRRRHVYIIGQTGTGKSTLLENMIFSDIKAGKGVAVIDPHGDLAEAVLRFVPKHRTNDVIYFDPSDKDFPVAFNILEGKNQDQRGLIASGLVGVIKKLHIDSWGPRLEHFLRNTILALVEAPDTTMLGITRMLVDKAYREKILHFVTDPMVQSFWRTEFSALNGPKLAEAVGPIQNKVGQFLSTPIIRNIVGQPKSTVDLRFAMDTGKIIIINLSKGKIGEDNSAMLGSLLITKFQIDAMSRADTLEKDRKDFYLYVDEFQNFATDSFATILSEARKYRLNLTLANQYVAQMSEEVKHAVFGNVGNIIAFRVGVDDSKIFAEQFDENIVSPSFLVALPNYTVYNRIMVNGLTSRVFSGKTLPPPKIENEEESPDERKEKIIKFSRQRYAKPREIVEDKIARWTRPEEEKYEKRKEKMKEEKEKKEGKTTVLEEAIQTQNESPEQKPKEEKKELSKEPVEKQIPEIKKTSEEPKGFFPKKPIPPKNYPSQKSIIKKTTFPLQKTNTIKNPTQNATQTPQKRIYKPLGIHKITLPKDKKE